MAIVLLTWVAVLQSNVSEFSPMIDACLVSQVQAQCNSSNFGNYLMSQYGNDRCLLDSSRINNPILHGRRISLEVQKVLINIRSDLNQRQADCLSVDKIRSKNEGWYFRLHCQGACTVELEMRRGPQGCRVSTMISSLRAILKCRQIIAGKLWDTSFQPRLRPDPTGFDPTT